MKQIDNLMFVQQLNQKMKVAASKEDFELALELKQKVKLVNHISNEEIKRCAVV